MPEAYELYLPALEIRQGMNRLLYSFAVDGKHLDLFATVSRVRRDDGAGISGYQRPEVLSHIDEIRRYLESENPIIPNALVVAFDSRVRFDPENKRYNDNGTPSSSTFSRTGTLVIPVDPSLDEANKPGWLVDGQQRAAALRTARVDSFPICIIAFITDNVAEQRNQFILVNSIKPLPKGLIYELLPSVDAPMPKLLQRRRFPASLLERLNYDSDSPLEQMIRTPTNPVGVIKDNSVLKMIENSLTDGALYLYRDPHTGKGNVEMMLTLLKNYWQAVRLVFYRAWGKPPSHSRLMHGAGIVSMGFVMDAISDCFRGPHPPTVEAYQDNLRPLVEICHWTNGYWDFGPGAQRKWNELQNTSKDIQLLANYLLYEYKQRI